MAAALQYGDLMESRVEQPEEQKKKAEEPVEVSAFEQEAVNEAASEEESDKAVVQEHAFDDEAIARMLHEEEVRLRAERFAARKANMAPAEDKPVVEQAKAVKNRENAPVAWTI